MTITTPRPGTAELDATLDGLLSDAVKNGDAAGVTLAIATADEVVYEGAAGKLRADGEAPATTDSLVWLLSQTKVFTVIVALQLHDEGRINLDDRVDAVLPEIRDVPVFTGWNADGAPATRPATTPVTFRHLITHTAGGAYPFFDATIRDIEDKLGIPAPLAGKRETLFRSPWGHEPGSAFEYGTNIDWLGLALERVGGADLATLVRTRVIEPLGLTNTTAQRSADQVARTLAVHARGAGGELTPTDLAIPSDGDYAPGGHFLYGTTADYVRLLQAILRGGELNGTRILSEEAARAGLLPQIGDLRFTPITSADPATTYDVDPFSGAPASWGWFGLINLEPTSWGRSAGSSFWAGLANTYWWIDSARGIVGAIGAQSLPFADPRVLTLQARVEQAAASALGTRN